MLAPPTRIYQLDGSAPYLGAAGRQATSGDRDNAWIVCPRRTTLVRRETWFPGCCSPSWPGSR
jgi:hypothetical protein